MLIYDNIEDTRSKLNGTMCFYGGKAVLVKECYSMAEAQMNEMFSKDYLVGKEPLNPKDFAIAIVEPGGRSKKYVLLSDPKFNYMEFLLGYVNYGNIALWWYRQPIRQYRQGLKHDQLGFNSSAKGIGPVDFSFNRSVADMMEGVYPSFPDAVGQVKAGAGIVAFHKDFAVSWDPVHQDVILEYKGKLIGHSAGAEAFKLMDNATHLAEALKEAIG